MGTGCNRGKKQEVGGQESSGIKKEGEGTEKLC